jgi:hypothetical protein
MGSPGGPAMQHLIEDEARGPDVALAGVGLGLEDLEGHVEGGADRGGILHALGDVLLGESEVADLHHSLREHDVGRFEVAASWKKYRWTMPSLTSAMNPLQIWRSSPMASASVIWGWDCMYFSRSLSHISWMM